MSKVDRILIRGLSLANILVYLAVALVAWPGPFSQAEDPARLSAASLSPSPPFPTAPSRPPAFPTRPPRPTLPSPLPTTMPIPSPTPLPTATPTFAPLLAPTLTPAPPFLGLKPQATFGPPPAPRFELAPEVVNIVLLGIDRRGETGGWRTDSIILLSLNSARKTVGLLSIPRDLWVFIPGYGYERINTADFRGEYTGYDHDDAALIKQTIEYNLGVPVHYYVRIDFKGFVRLVDLLGGVTVCVDCPIGDVFPDPDSPGGFFWLNLAPGVHHLDGKTALFFSRSRLNTSDFDRARRQQKVLTALWERTLSLNILPQIPNLWDILLESVKTDLTLEQVLSLAYLGMQLKPERIKSLFIDRTMTLSWVTPQGASVLLPIDEKVRQVVEKLFSPPDETLSWLAREGAKIAVLNGTRQTGLAELASARLRWEGFRVVSSGPADRQDYLASTIFDYSGKGYTLSRLCEVLGIPPASIQQAFDPKSQVDITVILGGDFQPCRR